MKKQFARVFSLMMISFFALGSVSGADQLTMQEGANINLSVAENGGNSTITISSTDTNTDEKVKVSSSDTADFLESQIVGGTGVTVNSDGSQITISSPAVSVEDSNDGVEVTVARQGEYDPGSGFVPVLDLNGTALVATGINPTVTIGGINANLLATSENPQQIIAGIPNGFTTGNYKLKVENNDTGFSEGLVYLNKLIGGNDADTVLLLHANGTGSTFTDSSASAHSVTANDNATQSSAQFKFDGGKSMLFDGTDDYLTIADSDDWSFGAGDFTVEAWVRFSSQPTSEDVLAIAGQFAPSQKSWRLGYYNQAGTTKLWWNTSNDGSSENEFLSTFSATLNTWYHIAITRTGGAVRAFVDGTQIGSQADSNNYYASSSSLGVGYDQSTTNYEMDGYIDELRISKGVARWTSDFSSNLPAAPYN